MIKQIIGLILIFVGSITVGNFISHHIDIPLNDSNSHTLIGLLLITVGVFLFKSKSKLIDSWNHFKDE